MKEVVSSCGPGTHGSGPAHAPVGIAPHAHFLAGHDGTHPACRYFSFWLICFLTHQTAINLFRCMGAIGRSLVVAYTMAWLIFLLLILLSGRATGKRKPALSGIVSCIQGLPVWFTVSRWRRSARIGIDLNHTQGGGLCA